MIPFSPKRKMSSIHFEMQGIKYNVVKLPISICFDFSVYFAIKHLLFPPETTQPIHFQIFFFLQLNTWESSEKFFFFTLLNLLAYINVSVSLLSLFFFCKGGEGMRINHKCRLICFFWYQNQLARLAQVFLFHGNSYIATIKNRERRLNIYEILWWLKL